MRPCNATSSATLAWATVLGVALPLVALDCPLFACGVAGFCELGSAFCASAIRNAAFVSRGAIGDGADSLRGGPPVFEPDDPGGALLGLLPLPGFTVLGLVLVLLPPWPSVLGFEVCDAFGLPDAVGFALPATPLPGPGPLSFAVGLAFLLAGACACAPEL